MLINLEGKRPTLWNLQGPFEASIINRNTWVKYGWCLNHLIEYFGKTMPPEELRREQAQAFLDEMSKKYTKSNVEYHRTASASFYTWMMLVEIPGVVLNPFRNF